MVCKCYMVSTKTDTMQHTMKKYQLDIAFYCQKLLDAETKHPALAGLVEYFKLGTARHCQTPNHSHSMVAGGLPEIS